MSQRHAPQRLPVPHIGPEPVAGDHEALSGKCRQRGPDRRPAHPVIALELTLGRELGPRPPNALLNLCPQHIQPAATKAGDQIEGQGDASSSACPC